MVRLTKHAREAVAERQIALAWIEATVSSPDRVSPDPRHLDRTHSYKAIAEFSGRVLRVVHRADGTDTLVITVHFDRGAKR